MNLTQNFNEKVEKVINADNFYQSNQSISIDDKNKIINELTDIKNEKSDAVKESKWKKFLKDWAGTISEVAIPVLKEFILPK